MLKLACALLAALFITSVQPQTLPASLAVIDPLQAADHLWEQRTQPERVEEAIRLYQAVPEELPQAAEAAWRLARCYWWLADHRSRSQRLAFLQQGLASAAKAVTRCPASAEGHYWVGACAGLIAAEKNNLEGLDYVNRAVRALETVIRLNPNHGMAQYTLSVIYRKAPGWPFSVGNHQKSLEYARQAVLLRPDVLLTHLGLAEILVDMRRAREARDILEMALLLPGPPGQEPETADQKAMIKTLLRILG